MVKICPKLDQSKLEDKELVQKLLDAGFSSFELHTTQKSDWSQLSDILSNLKLRVEAVHAPNNLKNGQWFNLCTDDDNAKISTDVLSEVAQFAKGVQSKKVVFHTWVVPYIQNEKFVENIEEARKKGRNYLVQNMLQVNNGDITLLPETSPIVFWTQNILSLCPVACTLEDFKEIIEGNLNGGNKNVGVAADIDHIYRTAVCNGTIYGTFLSALKTGKPIEEILENLICRPMLDHYNQNSQFTNSLVENEIDDLFFGLQKIGYPIPHIHTCGVAHPKEKETKSSLLIPIGEHIPVGYKGISRVGSIKGNVEDVLNHGTYLKHVKETDAAVILEFSPRPDYDFFGQAVNSKRYLEKVLAEL